MTGNPTAANSYLWDNLGSSVDVWAVLASNYYGEYTDPLESGQGISRARKSLRFIDEARARGEAVWTYNYAGTQTPSFTATEPLSDTRMLFLWSALAGVTGVLYGQGTTNYKGDPYTSLPRQGQAVLIYPSKDGPVPSARLEQIRDGIEDWEVFNIVRQRRGVADVRRILGDNGLFSATSAGVTLGCTIGCELKTTTPFSWPEYSHDNTTPRRIERANLQALQAASN